MSLIFDEETMLDGNIFKFENRLHSHLNRYIENGFILTTYYSQNQNETTVDRGIQNIEKLFGEESPLRFNKILNFPLSGFGQNNPDNTDEQQIEDITLEGECIIQPSTVIPKTMDMFVINHLKMTALFQVKDVRYDSMKVDGFYKIQYRLISTEDIRIQELESKVVKTFHFELNSLGSDTNPVLLEDDYNYKQRVIQMTNQMIESYRGLYYNQRHNCFLYHSNELDGVDLFDQCANEFIAKHGLMNPENSTNVIVLHDKLIDNSQAFHYNNSIFKWIELDAPKALLQRFFFTLVPGVNYISSSFERWDEKNIRVVKPMLPQELGINNIDERLCYFDNEQFSAFLDDTMKPTNDCDRLIYDFIHHPMELTIKSIPLSLCGSLLTSMKTKSTFFYTPILIYIIRKILRAS